MFLNQFETTDNISMSWVDLIYTKTDTIACIGEKDNYMILFLVGNIDNYLQHIIFGSSLS
ncbi:11290_t:CDS:2 [Scutellospora calospora]|uniref:11290_t:CDS:1 n=1 Tax=Scutellospora calospora TaxID=85575 RepID=A0ACA9LSE8_9GLOM|nr:11290_t:CDS:2 [Scutellospora calospora]